MARSTPYSNPVPTGASRAVVFAFAEEIASKLKFEPRDPLECVVERLGGTLAYRNAASYGDAIPDAMVVRDYDDFRIEVGTMTTRERNASSIAQEIGHLFLHYPLALEASPGLPMRTTRWVGNDDAALARAQYEAIWFGLAFLMPERAFRDAAASGSDEDLARAFGVTPALVRQRGASLASG